jgi:DNA-binding NtrC family response regulator
VPIHTPSLRERKEDIPLIVRAILARMAKDGAEPRAIDDAALSSLLAHDWPGNVRELRNVLERGVYLSTGMGMIDAAPMKLVAMPGSAASEADPMGPLPHFDANRSYRDNKEQWENEFERRYLAWLMQRAQGNISRAAREADMDRKYLHKLLKKHAIVT